MKKINNLTENFEDELETILRDEGIIDENGMVYADHIIAAQPFSSKDERVEFVENECISFIDEEYIYICKNDGIGDYGVERVLIRKYSELLSLLEEKDEDAEEFESYDVSFKIVSNRNSEVYVEGYVTINDAEAEDVDWYYYDAQGMATPQMFIEHDGVDGFKGATDKQQWEVEQFRADYSDDSFWIDEVILQSDDDENKTHVRENLTLIINEGAKMECELIHTPNKFLGFNQYFCEIIPRFNGEKINLAGFMEENNLILDPYGCQDDGKFAIDGSHIYCELSADYFEDGEIEYNKKVVNKDVEYIYKQYLTSELGVYGIASRLYEEEHGKLDESACDKFANNWEQGFESEDVVELYFMTEEDVERIIKEDGDADDINEGDLNE